MQLEEAEHRIREIFPTEQGSKDTLSNEEALALLDATEEAIRSGWRDPGESLATFLFYTCAKFDRWDVPTPVIARSDHNDHFERVLDVFRLVEGPRRDFVALFELDSLRTQLYQEAAIVPGRSRVSSVDFQGYRARLSQVPVPTMPAPRADYRERRLRIERILNGLERGSLKSALQLSLPYALHHRVVDAEFVWQDIHTVISAQPFISQERLSGLALEVPGAAVSPMHVSRWQGAMSNIRIQIDGLLDPGDFTPSLRGQPGKKVNPYEGWPSAYTFAFLLLYDFAWELRVNQGGEQHWIPAPADIRQVQYFLLDVAGNQLDMRATSIGGIEARYGESGTVALSLGELTPPPWWQRCRAQAALYLDLGDTPEALLWANIAAEALFEERFNEFADTLHRPKLTEDLNSPAAMWIDAEEIIGEQIPEMAGRVQWPDAKRHVSMYMKLKYIHRELNLACSLKDTQRHYATISRQRNSLFHGASSARPSTNYLVEVLDSLDWLSENFRLKEQGN